MLLVHPVNELIKFLPVLIGIFVLGSSGNGELWQLVGVAIPIGLGVLRFLTTRFRITATHIELQRGLLSRSVLTAQLDRVRAVELTSSPIHQLLGLAKVEIGTASAAKDKDESFALDGLPLAEARDLRVALLHRAEPAPGEDDDGVAGATEDQLLLRFDPRWVRFAPLTTSGSVIAAAVLAALGQFTNGIVARLSEDSWPVRYVEDHPLATVVIGARSPSSSSARCSRCWATSCRTGASRSRATYAAAPTTCAADCSPRGRPRSRSSASAVSRSASRSGCGWRVPPG